jgi:23S rRNA (cytidine1920-2'-O)/16S rRNA (cytidine1409-2'-O)-methyltransferase
LLVERGLFESCARAQAAIQASLVTADGRPVTKPSEGIRSDTALQAHPFVPRGGVKLSGALEHYPIKIENHVGLDVGASPVGFTEVLLANGASPVFAILYRDRGVSVLDRGRRRQYRIFMGARRG